MGGTLDEEKCKNDQSFELGVAGQSAQVFMAEDRSRVVQEVSSR